MKKIIYLISSIAILASCNTEETDNLTDVKSETIHPGKELMALNCNACHKVGNRA